jgi:hypothetical protein
MTLLINTCQNHNHSKLSSNLMMTFALLGFMQSKWKSKTFIIGVKPCKDELIIPVKLVLKAKQTACGKLDKLKARIVARGDMEKRRIKKTKAAYQKQLLQQRQEITQLTKTNTIPIDIQQPFEDTCSPCASSRGVKLLLSTTSGACCTVKNEDFIGAYIQAKVIGRHFVTHSLEYVYCFPEYAKYFGVPLLLDKDIYVLVYSGKYWNIAFFEWIYSQGFIQSQEEPSLLYSMTNTINGYASYSLLMTCHMLEATIPLRKHSMILSETVST